MEILKKTYEILPKEFRFKVILIFLTSFLAVIFDVLSIALILPLVTILINPDGQVFPCCYLANKTYKADQHGAAFPTMEEKSEEWGNWFWKEKSDAIMRKYIEHKDDLNVFNKPMEEIVNHPWFTEWLPESWEDEETRNEICVTFCEVPVDEEEKKEFFEKYTNSS